MTSTFPLAPTPQTRRATALAVWAAVILIALKAFALGASGSMSVLASLTESVLALAAALTIHFAVRRGTRPDRAEGGHDQEAIAGLVRSGLMMASAVFVGWAAVRRIFDPGAVGGGVWAVSVMLVALILSLALASYPTGAVRGSTIDRGALLSELGVGAVVLVGLASGAFLNAPGLDAAAGLVLAVWLFWGGATLLRDSRYRLASADVAVHDDPQGSGEPAAVRGGDDVGTSVPPT